jgi:hypothetical protein
VVKAIPYAIFSQWAYAGVGTAIDMNGRIAEDPLFSRSNPFGTDFFDLSFGFSELALGLFLLGFGVCTLALLRRSVRR